MDHKVAIDQDGWKSLCEELKEINQVRNPKRFGYDIVKEDPNLHGEVSRRTYCAVGFAGVAVKRRLPHCILVTHGTRFGRRRNHHQPKADL